MQDIKKLWKHFADRKIITASLMIQYAILRAMNSRGEDKIAIAKHLIRKSFTPIKSLNKLANGSQPYQALRRDINDASITPRKTYVTGEWVKQQRLILGVPADELLSEEERVLYGTIYEQVTSMKSILRRYSYFFTRQDIAPEYQLVQTAHAALELGNKLTPDQSKDLYFTVCGVPNLTDLHAVEKMLETLGHEYVAFQEPDIGNELTSIGVYPIEEHRRGPLRSAQLLTFGKSV